MPLPERDISYFIEVTVAYLNKLTGNEIVQRNPTIEFQSLVFSGYTGLLHLKGGAEGFVYLTVSQQFLQHLYSARHGHVRLTPELSREMMTDLTSTIAHNLHRHFGIALQFSEPRIFSTVPDDPIEMPPAVFVLPLLWRKEHAYLVLGITSPET